MVSEQELKIGTEKYLNKKKSSDEKKNIFAYYESLNIGFYLVTPLLVGVFLGLYLDGLFNTKPLVTITLILVGAIGSFYNLIQLTKDNGGTRSKSRTTHKH